MPSKRDEGFSGIVDKVLGNNNYLVTLDGPEGKKHTCRCYLAGRMKQFEISVLAGDPVRVVIAPPFELGRIVFRTKG